MVVPVVLDGGADDPQVPSVLPREGDFGESGALFVIFQGGPEPATVALKGSRGPGREHAAAAHQSLDLEARIQAPGVEGLCHISEIDRDEGLSLAEMFNQSQAVNCRILRVDWHESRIGLSMHGIDQDETIEESGDVAGDSAPTWDSASSPRPAG